MYLYQCAIGTRFKQNIVSYRYGELESSSCAQRINDTGHNIVISNLQLKKNMCIYRWNTYETITIGKRLSNILIDLFVYIRVILPFSHRFGICSITIMSYYFICSEFVKAYCDRIFMCLLLHSPIFLSILRSFWDYCRKLSLTVVEIAELLYLTLLQIYSHNFLNSLFLA